MHMQMDRVIGLNLNNYRLQGLLFMPSSIWLGFACADLDQDIISVWSGALGRFRVWSGAQDISGYISTLVRVYKYIKIHVTLTMSIYQNSNIIFSIMKIQIYFFNIIFYN